VDIRIAAYGVIVNDGTILLAHWNEGGRTGWTLPGGGLEDFETAEQAAVREIAEETGYTAQLTGLLGIDSMFVKPEDRMSPNGHSLHALRIIYEARVVDGSLTTEIDGSTDEARWVTLEQVAELPTVTLVSVALDLWLARLAQRSGITPAL
jgi:ADP-ribose pyrophosphatase YjhB (NUDIX family)